MFFVDLFDFSLVLLRKFTSFFEDKRILLEIFPFFVSFEVFSQDDYGKKFPITHK